MPILKLEGMFVPFKKISRKVDVISPKNKVLILVEKLPYVGSLFKIGRNLIVDS